MFLSKSFERLLSESNFQPLSKYMCLQYYSTLEIHSKNSSVPNDKIFNEVKTCMEHLKISQDDKTEVDKVKELRYNDFGIQMISESLCKQLFNSNKVIDPLKIEESLKELASHNLNKQQDPVLEVDIRLPKLAGNNIEEHFWNIGNDQAGPYKELLLGFIKHGVPDLPKTWIMQSGWTKYEGNGCTSKVAVPSEDALVLDVEVCLQVGSSPTIACAVSPSAWYGWVSEELTSDIPLLPNYTSDRLIPLENPKECNPRPKIVVGHNVSFDRARIKEQYAIKRTPVRFLDTMSVHICVSGVTSGQKAILKAGTVEEEWTKFSSLNSLAKVYELYCDKKLSKSKVDLFISGSMQDIKSDFQEAMSYCAQDVHATYSVLQQLFPLFLERFPHPVTLAGMLELQTAYIPVNFNWKKYITDSNQAYEDLEIETESLLTRSANEACKLFHDDAYKEDLWLWDQDWSTKKLKLKKTVPKVKNTCQVESIQSTDDENEVDIRIKSLRNSFCALYEKKLLLPARPPRLPGYPIWYQKLTKEVNNINVPEPDIVSTALRIIPKLLRLTWKSLPLHYEKGNGWGYLVPGSTNIPIEKKDLFPNSTFKKYIKEHSIALNKICSRVFIKKKSKECSTHFGLVKLPHKDGGHLNVGSPLARDFINRFSKEELSGSGFYAKRIIEISRMLSYWRNNRERIEKQLVCWLSKDDLPEDLKDNRNIGVILPQIVVCGTLTRRAVEPTWMTVSNAIVERIGSELRGIVHAPPGYMLVGADVDSQELWIAALLSDSSVGLHGATPFGWMTLNGRKSDGTDTHTVTAKAVGISRSSAKVLNYARMYGAGQKFSERLLKQFNTELSVQDAAEKAKKMISLTKGTRMYRLKSDALTHLKQRDFTKDDAIEISKMFCQDLGKLFDKSYWTNGTESAMFNCLERIANEANPVTPFLQSRLSRALEPQLDTEDKYLPTRINWVVQSGAVDFLHLMLVSMRWFLGVEPRFCLSFHDEVRYIVEENRKYEAAYCLHLTNLLTRSFCVSKLGMCDLPQSVAFFTSVEVDKVLRKESNDDNKTPSNPFGLSKGYGVPVGESLDIYESFVKSGGQVRTHLNKKQTM